MRERLFSSLSMSLKHFQGGYGLLIEAVLWIPILAVIIGGIYVYFFY